MKKRNKFLSWMLVLIFLIQLVSPITVTAATISIQCSKSSINGYYPEGTKVTIEWSGIKYINDSWATVQIYLISGEPKYNHSDDYNFAYYLKNKNIKNIGSTQLSQDKFTVTLDISDIPSNAAGLAMLTVDEEYVAQYTLANIPSKEDVDNKVPSIDYSITGTNSGDWYASNPTVTFTGKDADSGIDYLLIDNDKQANGYKAYPGNTTKTYTYQAVDKAGLKSNSESMTVKVDSTAPSISATPSQGALANGWYKGDTSITFNASDSESGLSSFKVADVDQSDGYKINAEQGTHTYTYAAGDKVGNNSSDSITLSVDSTAPTVSLAGGATTFTNKDVLLSIAGQDVHSGLKSMVVEYSTDNQNWSIYKEYPYQDNVTSEQKETPAASKNGYYRVKATDAVGYSTTSLQTIHITKIDKEVPTVVATIKGNEGAPVDNWYKGSATVTIIATDTGVSGLKQLEYNGIITSNSVVELPTTKEDINTYTYRATDNAGNSSPFGQTDIYVDASSPIDLIWTNNQNTWTNQNITVTMSARDIYSGVKKFVVQRQKEESGEWEDYTEVNASYETTLVTKAAAIKENGTYRFKAIDRVGYEATSNEIIITKIDKEKPVITPQKIGDVSSNGWYKDKVTLKLNVKEYGVSGLKNIFIKVGSIKTTKEFESADIFEYNHNELIDEEGITRIDYNALDFAGNSSDDGQSIMKVDQTKPTDVTASADTTIWSNSSVILTAGGWDNMSGLSKLMIQKFDNGSWNNYQTTEFNGENTIQSYDFAVEENGIYRVKAVDMVGFEMTSDISMGGNEVTNPKDNDPKPGIIIIDKIDKVKPLISAEIIGGEAYSDTSNGWYKDDARLKLTATDEASGVGTITCNDEISDNIIKAKTFTMEYPPFKEGINTFEYFATDVAGNNSDTGTTDVKIDMTKPVTSSITKLTNEWVSSDTGVIFECIGQDNESGLLQFVLERSENGTDGWTKETVFTYLGEITLETVNMVVKQNGYYRLAVYDRVQNISYSSDIISVDNIDETAPDGNSLGITPDTEEWVNEATGVNLTATGQDIDSGIESISVWGKTGGSLFETIKISKFAGETTLLETDYLTHLNGLYKSSATDKVGNTLTMSDEEALDVPNIDPITPTLVVDIDPNQWASEENGYEVFAYAKDSESGLNSIKLQMLNDDGDWKDTGIDFEKQSYIKNEEKLSTYEGNLIQNLLNKAALAVNKQFFSTTNAVANDKAISGTNEMVKALFKVTKNGSYRVVTDDVVANTTSSSSVVVTTMDFDSPTIMVEGNPTEWTNQTARIKVTAKDASSVIAKMTLNGKEVNFKNVNGAYFFTFDVENNATYQVAAYDAAGNDVSQVVDVTKIDKEDPFANSELGEWVDGVSNAKVSIGDNLSGIKSAYINEAMIPVHDIYQANFEKHINADITYLVTITDNAGNKVTKSVSENKALTAIKVTTPPDKTSYKAKENFFKKGMVVTAYYTDESKQVVTDYQILDGNNLAVKQDKINVSYTERGITKKDNIDISVSTESTPSTPTPLPSPDPTEPELPIPDSPKPMIPKPIAPKPTPVTPTPVAEAEEEVVEEKPEIMREEKIDDTVLAEEPEDVLEESNGLPFVAAVGAVAGTGMFLIFLFFMLTNVKVYSMKEEGKYKLIGRTRAIRKKEVYVVKTGSIMIMNASSGDFKFVFTKGFVKTHSDINIMIKIQDKEFNRYLADGEETIYVQYDE